MRSRATSDRPSIHPLKLAQPKIITGCCLEHMHECQTDGIVFAKRNFKRLIGKRTGGQQIAGAEGCYTSRNNQTDELREIATFRSQRLGVLDGVERLWRPVPPR